MAKKKPPSTTTSSVDPATAWMGNALLASLKPADRVSLEPHLEISELRRGDVLFEAGEDVVTTHFPVAGSMISLVLAMRDDREIEVATIGQEGAVGGIVSAGHKPAFTRMVVEIGGPSDGLQRLRQQHVGMQRKGLINYRRGLITIADRAGLEDAACECYTAVEKHFRAVLPDVKEARTNREMPRR